jgi:hypothetical protein
MSRNCVEYEWDQLQQRLDKSFNKYFNNDSKTSERKQQTQEPLAQASQSLPLPKR